MLNPKFDIETIAVFSWPFAVGLASILYRRSRGKPIFYRKPASYKFRQANASGRSHRSWFTRIGGANGCLVVQVTDNKLDIHPFFPFNLFFLPEIYGLEYEISLINILSARLVKKMFTRSIEVEFRTNDGDNETITLQLKHPEDFLAAIGFSETKTTQLFVSIGDVKKSKPINPGA